MLPGQMLLDSATVTRHYILIYTFQYKILICEKCMCIR